MNTIKLTELMNGTWKEFSISTCEERGIPQFADGLKPVQRFLIYQGFKSAKNNFDKVNAIGSSVSILGYAHGEASATAALTSMGAYFSNNLPFFDGDGSFGNVLDPTPAAPRYIFAKLANYIDLLLKDTELAPKNPDPEIIPPLFYLPIIPMCLVNGIKGIATGYAVDIPPHDPVSIIDYLIKLCDGKKPKNIEPKYYGFTGTVEKTDESYVLTGVYERKSTNHIVVKDLPPIFNTSSSYETFLRKIQDKGIIQSYENNSCDDNFNFDIWIKRGVRWSDEEIVKNLRLTNNHTWNLTTVMPNGKLHVWDKKTGINDIMNEFYNFRIPYIQQRIDNKIIELSELQKFYKGFILFLEDIINQEVNLRGKEENDMKILLKHDYLIPEKFIDSVMNAPLRSFTVSKLESTKKKLETVNKEYEYYIHTTKEKEYKKDLESLKKSIIY